VILAVGFRVRSPVGARFRQWATEVLSEYAVKGFTMDDRRLKAAGGDDYFEELLGTGMAIEASTYPGGVDGHHHGGSNGGVDHDLPAAHRAHSRAM